MSEVLVSYTNWGFIHSEGLKALKTTGNGNCLYNSASVLNQGDESANLVLRISVKNALHNKWVICKQSWQHFKLNLLTAFVNHNFDILIY